MLDTRSETVITHCKSQFARHGIPDILISDNGPQYACDVFRRFAKTYGFEHRTSSPTFPQSNGMAEKSVQTAKRLLKKAAQSGRDPYLALLDLRNTPRSSKIGSPAQRLYGRRTRTLLPTSTNLLVPKVMTKVTENLKLKRQEQKFYYDRGSHELPPLDLGENVRIRQRNNWQPGRVVGFDQNPRSVMVQSKGKTYRRNRKH
ncbi:uncharacterized protein K02A2.6-like [Mizuhopecten yessoensis]|uniref:uncharacterized protein K02A2.6-like n=1 Tax=Mizuhopecten yessoensis TaxID=6573 RepID=UPI000B45BB06|nr:uncharacterized protein K02A2.6-like [Mizuhopecten yessoensis]